MGLIMNNDFVVSIATLVDNYSHSIVDYLNEASLLLSKNFQHYEIILIIRKSIINDREILKNHIQHLSKIRIIELANNCDEDIAYSAALNSAIGDAVVLMDFIQDSLSLVPHMLNKIFAEETDVIIGNNISEYKESFWSRFLSKFFYKCAGLLCDQSVDFDRTHFSCYSRSAVNFMLQYKSNIRNLRLLRQLLGLKTTMINYA